MCHPVCNKAFKRNRRSNCKSDTHPVFSLPAGNSIAGSSGVPAASYWQAEARGTLVEIPQLKQRLDAGEDVLILDVRTVEDFVGEQGHIASATNIPVEHLADRLDEISNYQERPVVTICRTDRKSANAAQILAQLGFVDVHVARMGMTAWNEEGYRIEH